MATQFSVDFLAGRLLSPQSGSCSQNHPNPLGLSRIATADYPQNGQQQGRRRQGTIYPYHYENARLRLLQPVRQPAFWPKKTRNREKTSTLRKPECHIESMT